MGMAITRINFVLKRKRGEVEKDPLTTNGPLQLVE
jgi:hypothetical protein